MREALRNIRRRKTRSALTIFGVAIGIFALTTMGALAENLNRTIQGALDQYTSRVTVTAKDAGSAGHAGTFAQGGQLPASLTERIKVLDGVQTAYPTITLPLEEEQVATFSYPAYIHAFQPSQATDYKETRPVARGRVLEDGDVGKTVIGAAVARERDLRVGSKTTLRGKEFEVVGILERVQGGPDSSYRITLSEGQTMVRESSPFRTDAGEFVTDIRALPKPGTDPDQLAKIIGERINGVNAIPPGQFRKQIEDASAIFYLIILGSAIVAIVVGGLSVINTMVMSVSERRKEIGIKRVVGAKTRHILQEYLTETVIMATLGGALGFVLGWLVTTIVNSTTAESGTTIFTITPRIAIISFGFAIGLGWLAGLYPAWRATRVKPVTVLRED